MHSGWRVGRRRTAGSSDGKTVAIVAVVVVIAVVVIAVAVIGLSKGGVPGLSPSKPKVDVTAVDVELSGDSCSGDAASFSEPGGNVSAGSDFVLSFKLVNTAPSAGYCTFSDPRTTTAGFTVVGSNSPVTVDNGGNQVFETTFGTPSSNWTGVLSVGIDVATG